MRIDEETMSLVEAVAKLDTDDKFIGRLTLVEGSAPNDQAEVEWRMHFYHALKLAFTTAIDWDEWSGNFMLWLRKAAAPCLVKTENLPRSIRYSASADRFFDDLARSICLQLNVKTRT